MKKLPLLLLLFLLPLPVLANDIDLIPAQEQYAPHETALFSIILAQNTSLSSPLTADHFTFTNGSGTKISVVQSLSQLWSKEYAYTLEIPTLPEGTYTLGIPNIFYTTAGTTIQTTLLHNITITARNTTLLLRPGFLYQTIAPLEQPTFRITLLNTGRPAMFTINSTHPLFQIQPSIVTLGSQEQATVTIATHIAATTDTIYSTTILFHANDQTFTLPIILQRAGTPTRYLLVARDYTSSQQHAALPFTPGTLTLDRDTIQQTIEPNVQFSGQLSFTYTANQSLPTLRLVLTNDLKPLIALDTETITPLTPGEHTITLLINQNKNATHTTEGELRFLADDGTQLATLPITLLVHTPPMFVNTTAASHPPQIINQTLSPANQEQSHTLLYTVLGILLLIALATGYVLYQRGKKKPEKFEDILSNAMQR